MKEKDGGNNSPQRGLLGVLAVVVPVGGEADIEQKDQEVKNPQAGLHARSKDRRGYA